jgi:hypothetical protein
MPEIGNPEIEISALILSSTISVPKAALLAKHFSETFKPSNKVQPL